MEDPWPLHRKADVFAFSGDTHYRGVTIRQAVAAVFTVVVAMLGAFWVLLEESQADTRGTMRAMRGNINSLLLSHNHPDNVRVQELNRIVNRIDRLEKKIDKLLVIGE